MKKNVIITGASGNLGGACVQRFAKDDYQVIAVIPPGDKLRFEVPENVAVAEADLLNEKSTGEFISSIIKKYGTIDAALLLVGGYDSGDIKATDGAKIQKMLSLNFDSAYNCARPVFLQMISQDRGGRIVLVGARPALERKAATKSLAYALSKSLLFRLAEILNAEAEGKNVVTSVIVPSTIDTPANRAAMPKADTSLWVKPEKIAGILAFLTSDDAHPMADPVVKVYGNVNGEL